MKERGILLTGCSVIGVACCSYARIVEPTVAASPSFGERVGERERGRERERERERKKERERGGMRERARECQEETRDREYVCVLLV